jgi:hypothetical protein
MVVLVIGDSHLASKDFLLTSLQEGLVNQGAIVSTYAVCGSQPHDWVAQTTLPCGKAERHNLAEPEIDKSPKVKVWSLAELIRKVKPNLLIVELGDNMGGYGVLPQLPRDWITTQVREMLQPVTAKHLPCMWVGPPWGAEGGKSNKTYVRVKELNDMLPGLVAPCRYIDSLKFSRPGEWPTFDGEHLTPDGYRVWGANITNAAIQMLPQVSSR